MDEVLFLFHHLHHQKGKHEVHHCGRSHVKINPKLNYIIKHCSCGKHAITKKSAIAHIIDKNLKTVEIKIKFLEKCPNGGWHIESGVKA